VICLTSKAALLNTFAGRSFYVGGGKDWIELQLSFVLLNDPYTKKI
jgi:hypothetical protein